MKLNGTLNAVMSGSDKLLHTTTATLNVNVNLPNSSTVESLGWMKAINGARDWEILVTGKYDEAGTGLTPNEIQTAIIAPSADTVIKFTTDGATGEEGWTGNGTFRNLSLTGDKGQTGTWSVSIKGNGALSDAFDWAAYWAANFTGIPLRYNSGALLTTPGICIFRSILKVGSTYFLYEEYEATGVWKIMYRTSSDGFTWSAASAYIFAAGGGGEFDELGQADPTVIYDGAGDWKMWFDAKNGAGEWPQLGYATSVDGMSWTKVGAVITKGGAGTWDSLTTHHPACIKYNGVYYLYYTGSDTTDLKHIGLATSVNGINWTKEPTNPILSRGTGAEWDSNYIRPSCPIKIFNKWYMWYWGHNSTTGVHGMGLATSSDLITWTKQGNVLLFDLANPVQASCSILVEGTNPIDKIIEQWYIGGDLKYNTITLPTTKTRIEVFAQDATTYGMTTIAATKVDHAANYIYFNRLTVSANSISTKINIYFHTTNKPVTGKVKLALYQNGSDTPTNLLGITEEKNWVDITGGVFTKFSFVTPVTLSAADYWIAIWSEQLYQKCKVAGGANNWGNKSLAYGAFPDPVSATTNQAFSGNSVYLSEEIDNVYQVALVGEPTKVYFNNVEGTEKMSQWVLSAEMEWYWEANILYVYSSELPDLRYQITYE